VIVILFAGIVSGIGLSHPAKVYHSLLGASGAVTAAPYSHVIDGTAVHPTVSKVIV
jgi:hypothetical protein